MHNTVLAQEQGKKAEEFFTVGQKAQFRIVNINKEERKLALSTLLEEKKQEPKKVEPKKTEFKKESFTKSPSVGRAEESEDRQQAQQRQQAKPVAKKEKKEEAPQKVRGSLQIALESAMQKSDKSNKDGNQE